MNYSLLSDVNGGQVVLDALWNYVDTLLKEKVRAQQPEQLTRPELEEAWHQIKLALQDLLPEEQEQELIQSEMQRELNYTPQQEQIATIFRQQVLPSKQAELDAFRRGELSMFHKFVEDFLNLPDVKRGGFFPPDVFEVLNYELTRK